MLATKPEFYINIGLA